MGEQTFQKKLFVVCKTIEMFVTPIFYAMAILASLASIMIIALIGTSVTMRYLAYAPFRFTEELVGLLMTASFFLALPIITLKAKHVRVLIVLSYLPERLKIWVNALACLFGCGFCFWFFYLCVPWFQFAFDRQIKTEVGRLLMYPWMLILPISMALTIVAFFIRGILGNTEKIK